MHMQITPSLPEEMYRFFWDTNPASIQLQKHANYIIDRILHYGDIPSWKWLLSVYERENIQDRVLMSKQLSKKDTTFFSLMLSTSGMPS